MPTKELSLLRHAKSCWDDPSLDDFDRPLAARGERAAAVVGVFLSQIGYAPDRVLCSPARRTLDTLRAVRGVLPARVPVVEDRRIYETTAGILLDVLRETSNDVAKLLVICHNPATEELVGRLLSSSTDRRATARFPTAAFATLRFDVASWAEVRNGEGTLERFVTPKTLV